MILVDRNLNINLFMNRFTSDSANLCQKNDDLREPFEGFNERDSKENHFTYELIAPGPSQFTPYKDPTLPGTAVIRMGDLDLDGKIDLAITLTQDGSEPKTHFFMNQDCDEDFKKKLTSSGQQINWDKCRHFAKKTEISSGMSILDNVKIYSTSFFDFHEIG